MKGESERTREKEWQGKQIKRDKEAKKERRMGWETIESPLGRKARRKNSEQIRNSLVDSHSSVIIPSRRTPSTTQKTRDSHK